MATRAVVLAERCAHLVHCGCRGGVLSPEKQLHHLQCRTLFRGVVQRQHSDLRNSVAGAQPRQEYIAAAKDRRQGRGVTRRVAAARDEARVGSAACLFRCGGGLRVGVEQQLHHIERCALGGGVVQGQPFVLRMRRAAQHWCCMWGESREDTGEK